MRSSERSQENILATNLQVWVIMIVIQFALTTQILAIALYILLPDIFIVA